MIEAREDEIYERSRTGISNSDGPGWLLEKVKLAPTAAIVSWADATLRRAWAKNRAMWGKRCGTAVAAEGWGLLQGLLQVGPCDLYCRVGLMTRLPDCCQSCLENEVSSRLIDQLACCVPVVMIRQLKRVGARSVLLLPLVLIRADSTNSTRQVQVRHTIG